ncbi:MAG: threonylcarbamoyl-AMP synthase [Muribaculaceae bacterium]|nr:threonylcarbamoyl-AMP synthase [Muribaculaceae bacterium]
MTFDEDIKQAVATLKRGGLILYPTDTVWGIGCDATNSDAVERVYKLKQRADSKALILLAADVDGVWQAVENIPEVAEQMIEAVVTPTTIIYDHASPLVSRKAVADDGSIAVRVTSERYSRELCRRLRRPLVSTSANISGAPSAATFAEISPDIIAGVDYVAEYRRDDTTPATPSSIIKISDDATFKIIR